jgi:AsmA protein
MGKLIKFVLYTVLALVGVVAAVLAAVVVFVNPNDYKDQIAALVTEQTGRALAIEGDIDLSVFPWLGLEIGQMSLANAPGFPDRPMAAVEQARVRVKWLPMLEKRVEVEKVILDGLTLHLARDQNGHNNWDDLVARAGGDGGSVEGGPVEGGPTRDSAPEAPMALLIVGGLELARARVVWEDAGAGQHLVVENLNLRSGELALGQAADVQLDFDWRDQIGGRSGSTELSGVVTSDPNFQAVRVANLALALLVRGRDLPAERIAARASGSMDADLAARKLVVPGLELEIDAEGGELPVQRVAARASADVRADLAGQKVSVSGLKLDVDAEGDELPGKKLDTTLVAQVGADLAAQTLQVDGLQLDALGVHAEGQVTGSQIVESPSFTIQLRVPQANPREILSKLGQVAPATADAKVLTRASLDLAGNATPTSLDVEKVRLVADDSTVTGRIAVTDFAAGAVSFVLLVDVIDLDRYLPPIPEGETPEVVSPAAAAAAGSGALPADVLRRLAIDGSLQIQRLKARKLRAEGVKLSVSARKGLVQVRPIAQRFYKGTYRGDTRIDVRGEVPRISLNENLSGVQAGPLLKDLTGEDRLTGTGDVRFAVSAVGKTPAEMRSSLDGNGSFLFRDGAVKGFNLARAIRIARARLRGESLPPDRERAQTDFTELAGTLDIKRGVVYNDDLEAKSPFLRVTGAGAVDLAREQVDYGIEAVVVKTVEGQGGAELKELKGVVIPLKVTGPFADLSYKVDLKKALVASQKEKLIEKAGEKLDKVLGDRVDPGTKEQILEGLGRFLR